MNEQVKDTWKNCRYSEYAELILGSATILDDQSISDYQGNVDVFFSNGYSWKPSWGVLEYSYGSCSGCDAWEDENEEKVMAEMANCVLRFDDKDMLFKHIEALKSANPDWNADTDHGGYGTNLKQRIEAMELALSKSEEE